MGKNVKTNAHTGEGFDIYTQKRHYGKHTAYTICRALLTGFPRLFRIKHRGELRRITENFEILL